MNDPKKLVPPCVCDEDVPQNPPVPSAKSAERQRQANSERGLGAFIDPPFPQFTLQIRLDSPPVNSEPPCDCPPTLLQAAVAEAKRAAKSDFVTLQEITAAADVLASMRSPENTLEAASEASAAPEPIAPSDPVAAFVEASVAADRRAFTSTAEIMAAARVWCAENDLPTFHPRALAGQLKRRRGVQAHSNGQRRGWRGVKLR